MISQEKLKILTPLQKLPKNVGDLGKQSAKNRHIWSHCSMESFGFFKFAAMSKINFDGKRHFNCNSVKEVLH